MPYTRAELLAAIRADHPEFNDTNDIDLFRAVATDHPDLVNDIQEPEYKSPVYPGSPKDRTATQVRQAQEDAVTRGLLSIFDIPSQLKSVGGVVKDALTGKGTARGQEVVKGMVTGMVQPAVPVIKTTAGQAPPPESPEWEQAAEGSGAMLGGAVLPKVFSGMRAGAGRAGAAIRKGAQAADIPESLLSRAAKNRAKATRSRPLTANDLTSKVGLVRGVMKAATSPIRRGLALTEEGLAYTLGKEPTATPLAHPTILEPPPRAFSPEITISPETPYLPGTSTPNPTYSPASKGTASLYLSEPPAARPFTPDIAISPETPYLPGTSTPNPNYRPSSTGTVSAAAPETPVVEPVRTPEGRLVFEPPAELLQPAVKPPVIPADIKLLEQAIAPTGRAAQWSTGRNATRLAQEAPELLGVKPGPKFDKLLVDAFKRVEQGVTLAEDAIPAETTIPRTSVTGPLTELIDEFVTRGDTPVAKQLTAELKKWDAAPENVPWSQFRDMKRTLGHLLTNAGTKQLYGVLMDITSQISDELARANKSYSVVRRAIDDAVIDTQTGRRIKTIGKPDKPANLGPPPLPRGKELSPLKRP